MYYEFYMNLYFMENLIMNYLVLELAARVLGYPAEVRKKAPAAHLAAAIRRVLAAAAGSFGACARVFLSVPGSSLLWTAGSILFCFPMAALAFGIGDKETYKQKITAVFLISLLLGSTWYFLTNVCRFPFLGAVSAGYFFVWSVWRGFKRRRHNTQFLYDVKLERNGKTVFLRGFLDSGNHLREPVTGRAVHILEYDMAAKLLVGEEQRQMKELMSLKCAGNPAGKFFVVPYHTIGNNSGLLPVMEIDSISIKHGESVRSTKGVLAAVTETICSQKGAYQMILHPQILK